MSSELTAETIERYERRVEEVEAERKRRATMERFERRIEEIEAQIKPQLDEIRALTAGLQRLRQEAQGESATGSAVSSERSRAKVAGATTAPTTLVRRRR